LLLLAATMFDPLQDLLRTASLGAQDVGIAVAAALLPGLVIGFRIRAERRALLIPAEASADGPTG
jgi:hypothetical protein